MYHENDISVNPSPSSPFLPHSADTALYVQTGTTLTQITQACRLTGLLISLPHVSDHVTGRNL